MITSLICSHIILGAHTPFFRLGKSTVPAGISPYVLHIFHTWPERHIQLQRQMIQLMIPNKERSLGPSWLNGPQGLKMSLFPRKHLQHQSMVALFTNDQVWTCISIWDNFSCYYNSAYLWCCWPEVISKDRVTVGEVEALPRSPIWDDAFTNGGWSVMPEII